MEKLCVGDNAVIHSYKHDGSIHRAWQNAIVLKSTKDELILANRKTEVLESDGRTWFTREPAIIYFFKERWFNIIGMFKEDGIFYYCNLSSPYVVDDGVVKYIDYDLDLKVFPDMSYKILDREEFIYHKQIMDYPKDIEDILEEELERLIEMVNNREEPFNCEKINEWRKKYMLQKEAIR